MQRALPRRGCRQRSDGGSELRANDFPPLRPLAAAPLARRRHRPPGPRGSQAHRFRQLGHIQCGGQVKVQTARRDALFLSIRRAPMDKMHRKGTCGSGRLRSIIIEEGPKGRRLWLGRHPFWLKFASVSRSTDTCHPSSDRHFLIYLIWRALANSGRQCLFLHKTQLRHPATNSKPLLRLVRQSCSRRFASKPSRARFCSAATSGAG